MTAPENVFRDYCVKGMRKFVQTAIVIDNEAEFGTDGPVMKAEVPRAVAPRASILNPLDASGEKTDLGASVGPSDEREAQADEDRGNHSLDAKALTDAFHGMEVICGLYKPMPDEQAVDLATKAARHADIVILDWFLDKGNSNSTKAKAVIHSILKNDHDEHGRLRLIAVYTGECNVARLAKDVFDDLDADETLKGSFKLENGGKVLTRADARICFFNKPHAARAEKIDIVAEDELPERLMTQFAVITEGVLATFAVNAVAAVRRSVHHIIALFRKELDGAYLAHRCRLVEPDDAREFAADLIADELKNVIAMAEGFEDFMSVEVLESWIDHVAANNGHIFKNHRTNCDVYSVDRVKGLLKASGKNLLQIKPKDIDGLFFSQRSEAWRRSLEFARLSNLKLEPNGRCRFPDDWQPTLTLGTVLKVLRARHETEEMQSLYADLHYGYLVCVQPRCESVRLDTERSFPFQGAVVSEEKFNLVVKDDKSEGTELLVGWKPRDAVIIRFTPQKPGQCIRAIRSGDQFEFEDSRGRKFLWLGDIKDLKAQRNASELAQHIQTAGVNDYEWLRCAIRSDEIDFASKGATDVGGQEPSDTSTQAPQAAKA